VLHQALTQAGTSRSRVDHKCFEVGAGVVAEHLFPHTHHNQSSNRAAVIGGDVDKGRLGLARENGSSHLGIASPEVFGLAPWGNGEICKIGQ
jgi:hypothetical protein